MAFPKWAASQSRRHLPAQHCFVPWLVLGKYIIKVSPREVYLMSGGIPQDTSGPVQTARPERANYHMASTSEPRFKVDVMIHVFGMDADSRPFSQHAQAQNISDHGAKLSGLEKRLRVGEIIGVHVGDKKARFTVMWVAAGPGQKMDVGVKLGEGQPSPWQKEKERLRATATNPISRTKQPAQDKRTYPRHRIPFPIEIRDETMGST